MVEKNEKRRSVEQALNDPLLLDRPVDELRKLAKRLTKFKTELAPFRRQARIALGGGITTAYLAEILPLFLAQRGIDAEIRDADYGTYRFEILDGTSGYHAFEPDVTILLPGQDDLRHAPPPGVGPDEATSCAAREAADWRAVWSLVKGQVIQIGFSLPPQRPLGELDGVVPGGLLNHIRRVNLAMADAAPAPVSFVDMEALSARQGAALWQDERLYRIAKQPFAMEALPFLCNALAASAAAALGCARKALILDLDNTLWGGVIGDQGVGGIELGPETANGESYSAFQRYLKTLSARGVPLCVCSKNNHDTALEPFRHHSGMVLAESDIACFVANFENKADNIRAIARALNLGLDAFVFVDDSPVECAQVRHELPEVWTVELTGDPSGFATQLDRIDAFPITRLTDEDLKRAESYKSMAAVHDAVGSGSDLDGFLKDLSPVAVFEAVRPETVERICQLIAKTNQFKLNATRFDVPEIERRADTVLAVRLKDRLQDYGIVSVAVAAVDGDVLEVQNWVMSCRVFSRRLEYRIREELAAMAKRFGCSMLRLTYTPSGRNGLLGDLLPKLGFVETSADGVYEAGCAPPDDMPPHFMTRDAGTSDTEAKEYAL